MTPTIIDVRGDLMMKVSPLRALAATLIGTVGLLGAMGTCALAEAQPAGAAVTCPGTGITLTGGHVGSDWAGCDLSNDNFSGIGLANSDLTGVILQPGATLNFTSAHLSNVKFINANLSGANLSGANLSGANLSGATLSGTNFNNSTLATSASGVASGSIVGTPVNLSTALPSPAAGDTGWQITSNGYLVGPGANLTNAILTGANLVSQDLTGANLTNAILGSQNLTDANLTSANLTDATLAGAIIDDTNFNYSTLYGVSACSTTGEPDNLSNALPTGVSVPPEPSWQLLAGCLVGPGADLSAANFAGVPLAGATLQAASGAFGVSSGNVICPSTLPTSWACVGGYLIGPTANLDGAILTSANLSGDNLTGANLRSASLHNANLTGAILTGAALTGAANLGAATLTGVISTGCGITGGSNLPSGWLVFDGCLLGPTAVVSTADAPATFTNLENVLGSLTFQSETINNASFIYSNPINYLDSSFSNADLSDSTFTINAGSSLTFLDANFTGADLDGVQGLQNAAFSSVTWNNTICPDGTNSNSDGGTCIYNLNP
jgi:trimeric autotransporter adhesin